MKNQPSVFVVTFFVPFLLASTTLAGNLPSVTQFNSGDKARASDVNAVHNAIAAEVDDNANAMPRSENSGFSCRISKGLLTWDCFEEVGTAVINVGSVSITAPTVGKIVVSFSGYSNLVHTNPTTTALCYEINDTASPNVSAACTGLISKGFRNKSYRQMQIPGTAATGNYFQTVHSQRTYDVPAGTHTYYFDAQASIATGVSLGTYELTAMFFPDL